jgi:hypothetical protein
VRRGDGYRTSMVNTGRVFSPRMRIGEWREKVTSYGTPWFD